LKRHLEKVYDKCRRQLFACALSVTRCRDLAEDAIHEVFCRLLQQEVVPHNLKAYVFSSVRNCAIDLVRQMNRTTELVDDYIIDPSDNQRETAGKKQFHQLVADALAALSEDERETVVQHLYADLTFREIADLRNRPIGTITTWYNRGLAKLRDRLEE